MPTGNGRHGDDDSGALVLIANDHEWTARSLESILAPAGHRVVCVFTAEQALDRARSEPFDAFLIDRQLPDGNGADVCRQIRSMAQFGAFTPIVITTAGPAGRAERVEALRAGAWDFLPQPFDSELILLKLERFLESKRAADHFRRDAFVDRRTGLYSIGGLAQRGREMSVLARRRRQKLCCVAVAPELGGRATPPRDFEHAAEQLASVLKRHGRASDTIGRFSMIEFVLIAPGLSEGQASSIVARWESAIRDLAEKAGIGFGLRSAIRFAEPDDGDPEGSDRMVADAVAALHVSASSAA